MNTAQPPRAMLIWFTERTLRWRSPRKTDIYRRQCCWPFLLRIYLCSSIPRFELTGDSMRKRLLIASVCLIAISVFNPALSSTAATKKSSTTSPAMPDKAYLQKIWDAWATLDPAQEDQFHAQGQHTFYDETPLKYDSWAEYRTGVVKILAPIKSATFTVNDDVE